jgi:nicotinamidase-related amidase
MSPEVSSRRALIVIDVQYEYVNGGLRIEFPQIEDSLRNIGKAMDAANKAGIPTIVVQQTAPADSPLFAAGSTGWQLHPVVASRPRAHYVSKTRPNAFSGTDLCDWLQKNLIDTVTIAGYMTHNCNDATIKQAFDLGFHVESLMDACGSVSYRNRAGVATAEEIHRAFSVVAQSRFAAVLTTDEWIACLDGAKKPERDTIYASHLRARTSPK